MTSEARTFNYGVVIVEPDTWEYGGVTIIMADITGNGTIPVTLKTTDSYFREQIKPGAVITLTVTPSEVTAEQIESISHLSGHC